MWWIDIIGYVGMAFVLLSFLMKKVKWIRIVNMIGSVFSIIYGAFIFALPTICLNSALFIINLIFVIRLIRN